MKKIISAFLTTGLALFVLCSCNNSSTGKNEADTITHTDSNKQPAVTEGGLKDTTMHGFDSTRSKDSLKK